MHEFHLWAPLPKKVSVQVDGTAHPMEGPDARGYYKAHVEHAECGSHYGFLLDEDPIAYPDPRSLAQVEGVHKLSALYDQKAFQWTDER